MIMIKMNWEADLLLDCSTYQSFCCKARRDQNLHPQGFSGFNASKVLEISVDHILTVHVSNTWQGVKNRITQHPTRYQYTRNHIHSLEKIHILEIIRNTNQIWWSNAWDSKQLHVAIVAFKQLSEDVLGFDFVQGPGIVEVNEI